MLHLATAFPGPFSDLSVVAGVSLEVLWSKKTNLKLQQSIFAVTFFVYVHMCKCPSLEYITLCMLPTAYLPSTGREGRWTDPLNKMSPPNKTMINHTLQIISTCMNDQQSKALSPLSDCFHFLRQPPRHLHNPHWPPRSLPADPSAPPYSYREEVCLKRNNSPHIQKAILT